VGRWKLTVLSVVATAGLSAGLITAAAPAANASLVGQCPSFAVGYWQNSSGQVDHWYSGGQFFTGPHNGQQSLCMVPYQQGFQLQIIGGTANGDCVAYVTDKTKQGDGIDARGCTQGQAREMWYNNGYGEWANGDDSINFTLCLNVGTASGDYWGIATCRNNPSYAPEAISWQ